MMVRFGKCLVVCFLLCLSSRTLFADDAKVYLSPDGKQKAIVIPVNEGSGGTQVDIRTRAGDLICSRRFASTEEEGSGRLVEQASWSPNSRFFVFTTSDSLGRQPWNYFTFFFSRSRKQIDSFGNHGITITAPDFQIEAPDIFIGKRLAEGGDLGGYSFKIKLGSL